MKRMGILILAVFLVGPFFLSLSASAETKFKDVPNDHWAKKDITYLYEQKIINGYSNEIFGLNDSIKRVDAARMIVRALDLDTKNRPKPNLKDIKKGSKEYDLVATVVDEEIFFGSNGFFYPNNNLTRAEMAAVLTRAFELDDKNKKVTFKDIKSSHWSYKNIAALASNNITIGYADNTFRPEQHITRAEFSAFMSRILTNPDLIKDPKDNPLDEDEKNSNTKDPGKTNNENEPFKVIDIY